MDPELSVLGSAAATTIVQLLTTDMWERLKDVLASLLHRSRAQQGHDVGAELADARSQLLAPGADTAQVSEELTAAWAARLGRLMIADPVFASELKRSLSEELAPLLDQVHPTSEVRMRARASGESRVYQAGGNLTINER